MKLTRKKLKQLIEAFIAGPDGTVNLDAEPYEFMQHHPDPKIAAFASTGLKSARQSPLLSDREEDFEMVEYEAEIRNDPAFNPKKYKDADGSKVTDVYSRTMALYDSDPNFEKNLKEKVFDYIGKNEITKTSSKRYHLLQETAQELAARYFEDDKFFDIDGILVFEAEYFLEHLAENDARFDMRYAKYDDQVALAQKGRKTIYKIIEEAFEESGLGDALGHIYDSYDFG
jgi:hypothetical protein